MVFAAELYFTYTDVDSETRPLLAVVTGLVLYNGSVLAEIVRSGIKSLPPAARPRRQRRWACAVVRSCGRSSFPPRPSA